MPLRLGLTAWQTHDGRIADALLDHLGSRTILLAGKAYDARFFSKLGHFRRVANRYDWFVANLLVKIQLASMRPWLRAYESTA